MALPTESAASGVPTIAVQPGPAGEYVCGIQPDETVELRPVKVARVAGTETLIQDGLAPGDVVVTDGHLRLVPGSLVNRSADGAKAGS